MPEGISKDPHAFAMGFIQNSKHWRSQYIDKWREVIASFIVEPYNGRGSDRVDAPYSKSSNLAGNRNRGITLKGGETHKIIMTYASKLVLAALGDARSEYVQAEPSGYEDAAKAKTMTKLLRHDFTRPGFFRSAVETAMSRQQKMQAYDRLISYASMNPVFAAMLPNLQLAQELIGDTLELPEIAAMVGDPEQFQLNLMMQQLLGGGAGNGNGTALSAEPAGALPAQVSGAAGG